MPPRWVAGVIINVCGSVCINMGSNLMKLSHKHEKGEMSSHHRHPSKGGGRGRGRPENANVGGSSGGSLEVELPHVSRRNAASNSPRPPTHSMNGEAINGAVGAASETTALLGAPDADFAEMLGSVADDAIADASGRSNGGGSSSSGGGGGCTRYVKDATHPKNVWYSGASALVAGSLLNFVSMGYAPQSLLASLGSVQFVSNVVFGRVILHEVVTSRIIWGTFTIVMGNALVVAFSPRQTENFDSEQLKSFYDMDYQLLLLSEGSAAFSMHLLYLRYKRRRDGGQPLLGSEMVMPLAYAICSAIVGTQSVIQAKCLSELLSMTFRGDNQLVFPFTYMVLFLWLVTTVFWLVRMNRALAQFHGLFIIPALQVCWTFFSVLGGGFYFKEFHDLTEKQAVGFAGGVCVVFWGVYMLAPRSQVERKASLDDAEESLAEAAENGDILRRTSSVDSGQAGSGGGGAVAAAAAAAALSSGGSAAAAAAARLQRGGSMEAGDEAIDWDHTRMVSFGFFPVTTTDEDMAQLAHPFSPDAVVRQLGAWCDGANSDDASSAAASSSSNSALDHGLAVEAIGVYDHPNHSPLADPEGLVSAAKDAINSIGVRLRVGSGEVTPPGTGTAAAAAAVAAAGGAAAAAGKRVSPPVADSESGGGGAGGRRGSVLGPSGATRRRNSASSGWVS